MTDPTDDLFGRPTRGAFPKLEELDGRLLLIKPSKSEQVDGKFGPQTRITADVVVLDAEGGVEEHDDMYLSQRGLISTLEKCLKPGTRHPYVLGRLDMFPAKDTKDAAEKNAKGIRGVLDDWLAKGAKGNKPPFAWGLADFTDDDAAMARRYLAEHDSFAI